MRFYPANMFRLTLLFALCALSCFGQGTQSTETAQAANLRLALGFELPPSGTMPGGWYGNADGTMSVDESVKHSGKYALRIERTSASAGKFSTVSMGLPMGFQGKTIELRGFVKTDSVSGFAGLWIREDGERPNLAFDSMEKIQLKGTTDWTEYSISIPVHQDGLQLQFGFLMAGSGKAWADDLQVLVDGKPILEAPKAVPPSTVLDEDHQFDEGSKIDVPNLSASQIQNLVTLGKVWGFLKYHHPKAVNGQVHWDYELLRVLPSVLAAPDQSAANGVLFRWIKSLGPVDPPAKKAALDRNDYHLEPDIGWLTDRAVLGPDLSSQLETIYANRAATTSQFYVSQAPGIGNALFPRESYYKKIKIPDAGFQLLALYRFWNIIRYWYPYRDVLGENWDAVLAEFIPRVVLADNESTYAVTMMALVARVNDTHANLWSSLSLRPPVGNLTLPVTVRFIKDQAVVTAVFSGKDIPESSLRVGDIIQKIDGVPVAKLVEDWLPYYAASNKATKLRDIARSLTKGAASDVKLVILRSGEEREVAEIRQPAEKVRQPGPPSHDLAGPTFRLLSPEVAYLKLSSVELGRVDDYVRQAAGTKGWIIDIRNYPSAFVVYALGAHLVDKPTAFVRATKADFENPGAFYWDEPMKLSPIAPQYTGRVIVLLDEVSQSQAEFTAMAFQVGPGAKVIGSTTAGADGDIMPIPLPGNLRAMMSGIGIFYPDKRPTQRIGILPDIEVTPTVEGIKAGRDELLDAALREILGPGIPDTEISKLYKTQE